MPLYPPLTVQNVFTPADHGWLAWNSPSNIPGAGTVMPTAGLVTFVRIKVPVSITVTNIVMYCSTAGGTLTAGQCFAALYTSNSLVAATADQAAAWVSSGLKTMALAGGPFALAAGLNHSVAFWFNGTTGPTWARVAGLASGLTNAGLASPNFEAGTADASITTTGPPTMGAQTAAGVVQWAALS